MRKVGGPLPKTLEALDAERSRLVLDLQDIQAQLANKNATDKDGNRIPEHQYHEWRLRAVQAQAIFQKRLVLLNQRIKELRRERLVTKGAVDSADPMAHLAALHGLCRRLIGDGVDFTPEERALIDGAQHFLQFGGKS